MSLGIDYSALEKVQFELDHLSELSMKINDCQNEIINYQHQLKETYEKDRKILLDMRLTYGKKIEEADNYYHVLLELEKDKASEAKLKLDLNDLQNQLNSVLSEISPDNTEMKYPQIKNLRGKINQIKLDLNILVDKCKSNSESLIKLKNKYGSSIYLTKDYFSTKLHSKEVTKELMDLIKKCEENVKRYKNQYSLHMSNLENISTQIHLQRSAQDLINVRLNESMSVCDCLSISSFEFGDDEKFTSDPLEKCDNFENEHYMSQSQSHFNPSRLSNDSPLPSCKSLNLPRTSYGDRDVDKKSQNLLWHPLL